MIVMVHDAGQRYPRLKRYFDVSKSQLQTVVGSSHIFNFLVVGDLTYSVSNIQQRLIIH